MSKIAFFASLLGLGLAPWMATGQTFLVPENQKQLFIESAKKRLQLGHAPLACVRIFYGKPDLIQNPLDPLYYSILERYRSFTTPDQKNTLSVVNGWDGVSCQSMWGYCMAYSALTRDLNLLLHFDPQSPRKVQNSAEWERQLFETWRTKQPLVISGYESLYQFSSSKEVKAVLANAIPWVWGDLATLPQIALRTTFESRSPMNLREAESAIDQLSQMRKKGYLPLVYLGAKLESSFAASGFSLDPQEAMVSNASLQDSPVMQELLNTYIHVVQLLEIETLKPGSWRLKFIDPNIAAPHHISTLTVNFEKASPLQYQSNVITIRLDRFGVLPGDREHMDEIVSNLVDAFIEKPKEMDRLRPLAP